MPVMDPSVLANRHTFQFDLGDGRVLGAESVLVEFHLHPSAATTITICRAVRLDESGCWDFLFKDYAYQRATDINIYAKVGQKSLEFTRCEMVSYTPVDACGNSSEKLCERAVFRTSEYPKGPVQAL